MSEEPENNTQQPLAQQPLTQHEVAALFAEHGQAIERFLQGVLRDNAQAVDCLQATFAKLISKGHASSPETRRGWLFTVAYQEAMLIKRNTSTNDRVLRKIAWWKEGLESNQTVGESLIREESIHQVQAALELLSFDQRCVVRMRIYEGKTFAEISEELKIPLGTALWRMQAALEKLRKILVSQ